MKINPSVSKRLGRKFTTPLIWGLGQPNRRMDWCGCKYFFIPSPFFFCKSAAFKHCLYHLISDPIPPFLHTHPPLRHRFAVRSSHVTPSVARGRVHPSFAEPIEPIAFKVHCCRRCCMFPTRPNRPMRCRRWTLVLACIPRWADFRAFNILFRSPTSCSNAVQRLIFPQ